jgi:hypothetical protein
MSFWNGHRWEAGGPPTADAKTPSESRVKRFGGAALEGALITALVFGLIAGTAFAGRGGGGGGSKHGGGGSGGGSLSLVLVNDVNGNGAPDWGDTVTFNVSTANPQPNLDLTCKQGGVVVYGATTGYYASYPWPWTQNMTLGSAMWTGGSASCTARLYAFAGSGTTTLATLSFTAGG